MFRFLLWTAIIVGSLVGILRLVAIRWWRIPSDDPILEASIAPTLRGGDLVLLWRATQPGFGDLVVCPDPEDPSLMVIGRIVGEEGDRVVVEGSDFWVNDSRVETEHACAEQTFDVIDPDTGNEVELNCDIEAVGGVSHMRGRITDDRVKQRVEREVGEGRVFLLSDDRAYPYDSRHFGNAERKTCRESVFFRLVSRKGFFDVENRLTYIR